MKSNEENRNTGSANKSASQIMKTCLILAVNFDITRNSYNYLLLPLNIFFYLSKIMTRGRLQDERLQDEQFYQIIRDVY